MSVRTEQWICQGAVGPVECSLDFPEQPAKGWALVLHPHPLHGGTRDNKVVTTIARACVQQGLLAVRPNFRGVGASAGDFDAARGETEDMLRCVAQFVHERPALADQPWLLAGFSFGSAVAAQLYARLAVADQALPARLVLAGCAVDRFRHLDLTMPSDALIVHGQHDDVVPLDEAIDFARTQDLPITVVPDASHFFDGKLLILRQVIRSALAGF